MRGICIGENIVSQLYNLYNHRNYGDVTEINAVLRKLYKNLKKLRKEYIPYENYICTTWRPRL